MAMRWSVFRMASLLWMAGITLLMVPMATLFDVPIARWLSHEPLPHWVGPLLNWSIYYAQGTGVLVVLTLIILFKSKCRWVCAPFGHACDGGRGGGHAGKAVHPSTTS